MANEKNDKFVDKARSAIRRFVFGKDQFTKKQDTENLPDIASKLGVTTSLRQWYDDLFKLKENRQDKYEKYKYLDQNLPEAEAGLSVYADNIVSGTIGKEEAYSVVIDEQAANIEAVEEIITDLEVRTRIKDDVWDIARDLTRDGDVWSEIILTEVNGKMVVDRIKDLPSGQIFADVDDFGRWKDPEFPYIQKTTAWSNPEDSIKFDWWRIIHWKLGRRVYGVDRSLFANSSSRIGRELIWIYDCMVIARMTRAWQRYAYLVDTSGMPEEAKFDYLDRYMERVKRRDVVDQSTGRLNVVDNPPLPDDDIAVPVDNETKQGIQVLSGDFNIGNIPDVEYLQDLFFMGILFPKAYAAKEQGVRGKATMGYIDVQFARQVRRKQNAMKPGLRKFYETEFVLHGIDPDSFDWDIVFPELATMDELMKWNIMKVKAEIAEKYIVGIGALNNEWLFKEVLGFDDDQIKAYASQGLFPPEQEPGEFDIPMETRQKIAKDPLLRPILSDLIDIVKAKQARDDIMKGKKAVGLNK